VQLGRHLRELYLLRWALPLCLALALYAGLSSAYDVNLLPPGLGAKELELGTADAHVLVDTPSTTVLDLRQGTDGFDGMTHRAVLLGNVMASVPVREYIARRAGVPADAIQITTPTTADFPRRLADAQHQPHMSDLRRSPDEYLIKVWANPTVPVLDVYAQGPGAKAAEQLANGAVDGLRDYVAKISSGTAIPASDQVQLRQLGRAHGTVLNDGIHLQMAAVVFLVVFALSSAAAIFFARVRNGWRTTRELEELAAGRPSPAGGEEDFDWTEAPVTASSGRTR